MVCFTVTVGTDGRPLDGAIDGRTVGSEEVVFTVDGSLEDGATDGKMLGNEEVGFTVGGTDGNLEDGAIDGRTVGSEEQSSATLSAGKHITTVATIPPQPLPAQRNFHPLHPTKAAPLQATTSPAQLPA